MTETKQQVKEARNSKNTKFQSLTPKITLLHPLLKNDIYNRKKAFFRHFDLVNHRKATKMLDDCLLWFYDNTVNCFTPDKKHPQLSFLTEIFRELHQLIQICFIYRWLRVH